MTYKLSKDGYTRWVHDDCVDWYIDPDGDGNTVHNYCISRFPFVPNYHLCVFVTDDEEYCTEYPMQTFKTLAEALAVLRVLAASTKD